MLGTNCVEPAYQALVRCRLILVVWCPFRNENVAPAPAAYNESKTEAPKHRNGRERGEQQTHRGEQRT